MYKLRLIARHQQGRFPHFVCKQRLVVQNHLMWFVWVLMNTCLLSQYVLFLNLLFVLYVLVDHLSYCNCADLCKPFIRLAYNH